MAYLKPVRKRAFGPLFIARLARAGYPVGRKCRGRIWTLFLTGDWKVPRTRRQECRRYVAQAFQPPVSLRSIHQIKNSLKMRPIAGTLTLTNGPLPQYVYPVLLSQ